MSTAVDFLCHSNLTLGQRLLAAGLSKTAWTYLYISGSSSSSDST